MRALLFDLDGTLIDSFPLWAAANIRILKKRGVAMDERTFLTGYYQQGLHHHGIVEKSGLAMSDAEQFYRERNTLYTRYLREKIEWMADAGAILKRCAEKVPLGLMTGTTNRDIDALNTRLHLSDLFKVIVTADDVGIRMKPDPYGLLLLTEKMGVKPEECAYVGDQSLDVHAAHNAHMPCWLLQTENTPPEAAAEADRVLKSLADIAMEDLH